MLERTVRSSIHLPDARWAPIASGEGVNPELWFEVEVLRCAVEIQNLSFRIRTQQKFFMSRDGT